VPPTAVTRQNMIGAINDLNMLLISWANRGVNLWTVKPFTIQLVANQPTYTAGNGVTNISPYATSILDCYYSLLNGGGAGINTDRIMLPMSRTDYDTYSNKLQPGLPSMYWFQKLPSPTLTIYQVAQQGYPVAQLAGHYLSLIQTANVGGAETPDAPYLAYNALYAELAGELSLKHTKDPQLRKEIKDKGMAAWEEFADTNREDSPIKIWPAMGSIWDGD
jgi:hypothetical protein